MAVALKVLAVIIPIGVGFLFRTLNVFSDRDGEIIRRFVVKVAVPALVFFSMYDSGRAEMAALPIMLIGSTLVTVIRFGLGWLASFGVAGNSRKAAVHVSSTFGNYGWLGFGVMHVLLGDAGLRMAVFFVLLWWPLFYGLALPAGMIHGCGGATRMPWRGLVRLVLPVAISIAAGLGMNLGGMVLPGVLESSLRPFARATVPLILFSVGMQLRVKGLLKSLKPALLVSACVLVVAPCFGLLAATALTADPVSRAVIALESAMPTATLTPILADYMDMDTGVVNAAIVISTCLSMITLPLLATIAV